MQVQERDSQVVGLRKRLVEVEAGSALRISTLEGQLKEQSSRMRAVEQEMNMLAHAASDAKTAVSTAEAAAVKLCGCGACDTETLFQIDLRLSRFD